MPHRLIDELKLVSLMYVPRDTDAPARQPGTSEGSLHAPQLSL